MGKAGTKMKTGRQQLDPSRRSNAARNFETSLRQKIVGQDSAVEKMVEVYQVFLAGLNPVGRPIGNLLFLGPTGTGKTRVVEAAAEILFGDPRALIKVDCAEFQHSHEIAKLIGSPPGYLGHRETHPLITQEALAQYHKDELKLSFLLFDEIEKASDALWSLLLGMLDKATLTLGDNRRVDLSRCVIILTSNLGGGDMVAIQEGGSMGFTTGSPVINENFDKRINDSAINAARRKFTPEFMNRIDKLVVFNTLRDDHLKQILDIELGALQTRVLASPNQFIFACEQAAKDKLLNEGTDMKYGARHLKRTIERNLTYPLANLVSTEQIKYADKIKIDLDEQGEFTFEREAEGALLPIMLEKFGKAAQDAVKATTQPVSAVGHPALGTSPRRRKHETDGIKGPDDGTTVF
jgi:ATP-dependent Clp protease ATP-binding subunit ClpB